MMFKQNTIKNIWYIIQIFLYLAILINYITLFLYEISFSYVFTGHIVTIYL